MKKWNIVLLALLFTLSACKKGDQYFITILSPANNAVFHSGDTIPLIIQYVKSKNNFTTDSVFLSEEFFGTWNNLDSTFFQNQVIHFTNRTIDTTPIIISTSHNFIDTVLLSAQPILSDPGSMEILGSVNRTIFVEP